MPVIRRLGRWRVHSCDNATTADSEFMRLREVLGDASENPRFVETIPRRGYRFIAPVVGSTFPEPTAADSEVESGLVPVAAASPTVERAGSEGTPQPTGIRRRPATTRFAILFTAILALAVLVGAGLIYRNRADANKAGRAQNKSLIVPPIENLSGDKHQEYFADGMTDDLIANLAKIRSLRVISRSTAMAFKGTRKPISQSASELNVDAVFEGTVLRVGNRVRVTAELVQLSTASSRSTKPESLIRSPSASISAWAGGSIWRDSTTGPSNNFAILLKWIHPTNCRIWSSVCRTPRRGIWSGHSRIAQGG